MGINHHDWKKSMTKPSYRLLSLVPLVCLMPLAACSGNDDRETVIRSDSSGVELVYNRAEYRPIRWAFDTAFAIGGTGDSAMQRVVTRPLPSARTLRETQIAFEMNLRR